MNTSPEELRGSMNTSRFERVISERLVSLFRPLAKLCFKLGLTHRTVTSAVRRAFVEVAHQDRTSAKKPPTYSRISLLTGIDRKQVVDILANAKTQVKTNPAVDIVEDWAKQGGDALKLKGTADGSFQHLVREHCADLSYTTLFEHLQQQGAVAKLGSDRVILQTHFARPDAEQLDRLSTGFSRLVGAAQVVVDEIVDGAGSNINAPLSVRSPSLEDPRAQSFNRDLDAAIEECRKVLTKSMQPYGEDAGSGTRTRIDVYRYTE